MLLWPWIVLVAVCSWYHWYVYNFRFCRPSQGQTFSYWLRPTCLDVESISRPAGKDRICLLEGNARKQWIRTEDFKDLQDDTFYTDIIDPKHNATLLCQVLRVGMWRDLPRRSCVNYLKQQCPVWRYVILYDFPHHRKLVMVCDVVYFPWVSLLILMYDSWIISPLHSGAPCSSAALSLDILD